MTPGFLPFVFAETLLALNVVVWIGTDWRVAAAAVALMFATYRAHAWAQR